jgi:hypothetical protein
MGRGFLSTCWSSSSSRSWCCTFVRPLGRSIRCTFLQATAAVTGESPPGLEECSFEESLLAKAPEEFRSTSPLMEPLQVGGAAVTRELPVRTSTLPRAEEGICSAAKAVMNRSC